ncbi:MAG: hypothetical protein LUG60_04520 [Erysipelotrichaceae bacterium]|nr:hypothetical protein [Erysipelotrichaceae bacterium]
MTQLKRFSRLNFISELTFSFNLKVWTAIEIHQVFYINLNKDLGISYLILKNMPIHSATKVAGFFGTSLSKVATLEGENGIINQDYFFNTRCYVDVMIEDDSLSQEEFKEEMNSLNNQLKWNLVK